MALIDITDRYQHKSPVRQLMDRALGTSDLSLIQLLYKQKNETSSVKRIKQMDYFVESRTACGKLGTWLGS